MITLAVIAAWLLLALVLWGGTGFEEGLFKYALLVSTIVTAIGFTLWAVIIYWVLA